MRPQKRVYLMAAFSTASTTAMLLFSVVLHVPALPVSSFQSIPSICCKFAKYRFTTTSHFVQRRRTTTTTTMMSSTSPAAAAVTKLTDITSIFGGGDYAGLFATFSSETGKLVSVPEQLGENRAYLFLLMICFAFVLHKFVS